MLKIPDAPMSIQKGVPLKSLLDIEAITQLGENLGLVYSAFDRDNFISETVEELEPLSLKERSLHIAKSMRKYLPEEYSDAVKVILNSLTPPLEKTEGNGLAVLFYMPHCSFIEQYGIDRANNNNRDPFEVSMHAQAELTKRFTCEYSIRPFIVNEQERTMEVLYKWMKDSNPHLRRLCSEGTRPRLPWSKKIDDFVLDPEPCIPILECLKNDSDLYVRRSVANHIGDIAKDNLDIALDLCEKWLKNASPELKWVIRHAVRNPVKRNVERAIDLRNAAK
ncbi:MAG: DNA alkylation repair protein [Crocinitomicaceae bacterium]|nr:DNA alkylation repair protein [Flavobacteriales bacterium]NQZ35683.1 DNA alkylation repair protein [Crocinitomicaceae bacterium]